MCNWLHIAYSDLFFFLPVLLIGGVWVLPSCGSSGVVFSVFGFPFWCLSCCFFAVRIFVGSVLDFAREVQFLFAVVLVIYFDRQRRRNTPKPGIV